MNRRGWIGLALTLAILTAAFFVEWLFSGGP